jgi:hypothetical protein
MVYKNPYRKAVGQNARLYEQGLNANDEVWRCGKKSILDPN